MCQIGNWIIVPIQILSLIFLRNSHKSFNFGRIFKYAYMKLVFFVFEEYFSFSYAQRGVYTTNIIMEYGSDNHTYTNFQIWYVHDLTLFNDIKVKQFYFI